MGAKLHRSCTWTPLEGGRVKAMLRLRTTRLGPSDSQQDPGFDLCFARTCSQPDVTLPRFQVAATAEHLSSAAP